MEKAEVVRFAEDRGGSFLSVSAPSDLGCSGWTDPTKKDPRPTERRIFLKKCTGRCEKL